MNLPRKSAELPTARGMARTALLALFVLLVALAWVVLSRVRAHAALQETTAAQARINVSTIRPKLPGDATLLTLPASVQANLEAPIYARTSGYLKRWQVDIGAPVRAGQLLAEIDAPEVDQQLRQAEADLATAQVNRNIAQLTAERWRGLRDSGSVARQEADEKISLAAGADAQLHSAAANLQRLHELSAFKRIVAPFAGVVTARNVDVGQLVNAGNSAGAELFRVADLERLRVYVHVPQSYASLMQPGQLATVTFPDRLGVNYPARLESTARALDPGSRTMLAQLIIDNARHELLPGAYAEVNFKLAADTAGHRFRVPANTLIFRGEGVRVATVDAQQRARLKPVTIGRDYGAEVEVVDGLQADDQLIMNPQDSLIDNAEVRVVQPAAAQAAPR
jgi:RND family efflux transporter MFP subunit